MARLLFILELLNLTGIGKVFESLADKPPIISSLCTQYGLRGSQLLHPDSLVIEPEVKN